MSVGTLTFHWVTNYGALLQAYALQQYLMSQGWATEIIDYKPGRTAIFQALDRVRGRRLSEFAVEARMRDFRREYLRVSDRTYRTNRSLRRAASDYDTFICGSDQVWNESFVHHAERTPTLSYYLDFVPDKKSRIAYAASFGTDRLTAATVGLVLPELRKFAVIGVRETTGRAIVEELGLRATVVADPTLLLPASHYAQMTAARVEDCRSGVFSFVLHRNQPTAMHVMRCVNARYSSVDESRTHPLGVLEWLARIRNAEFVVTNSYHAAIFAILFHTPFISVTVEGSSMNDRLATLLGSIGLERRLVADCDSDKIGRLCDEEFDWRGVDDAIAWLRMESGAFLVSAVSGARR